MKEVSKELLRSITSDLFYRNINQRNVSMYVSFPTIESAKELLKEMGFICPKNILLNHYYNFPRDFNLFKKLKL